MSHDAGYYAAACICSALIGMWVFLVVMEAISAGTAATFVCLAVDPATLMRMQPELFYKIQETWPEVTWGVGSKADDASYTI